MRPEDPSMLAMVDEAMTRDIRVPITYGGHDVRAIAEQVGMAVTDDEAAVILDHVDREINKLARSAAEKALRARIVDLLEVVRSTRPASGREPSTRRRTADPHTGIIPVQLDS
jgi:hypothetical protein